MLIYVEGLCNFQLESSDFSIATSLKPIPGTLPQLWYLSVKQKMNKQKEIINQLQITLFLLKFSRV